MKDTLEEAKSALAKVKDNMARYYNHRCSPAPTFSPGDAQQTSLGSDDPISRQQIDALDTLINKSNTSSRLIPYLYANI